MNFLGCNAPRVLVFLGFFLGSLSLSSCGNGNLLGNGSGTPGTAAGALQVANVDIAKGDYSGAISVLSPYCPNNNCINSDIANAYANAYIALGSSTNGSSSSNGATITQVLSNVLTLVNGSSFSSSQIFQGISQAVPCISSNSCGTNYLSNLATALQALANTPCSGSVSNSSNCPNSSTILLSSAVYLLAVAQNETGIVYNNGQWEACAPNGGGLSGCTALTSVSTTTLTNDLNTSQTLLQNVTAVLGATCPTCSGSPSITVTTTNAINVLPYFTASLGSLNSNISTSFNRFLNAVSNCTNHPSSTCSSSPPNTAPTSVTLSATGLADYLSQL